MFIALLIKTNNFRNIDATGMSSPFLVISARNVPSILCLGTDFLIFYNKRKFLPSSLYAAGTTVKPYFHCRVSFHDCLPCPFMAL